MKIHPITKYFWTALSLCLGVILLGISFSYFAALSIENKSRKELLGKTTQASLLVNVDQFKTFTATGTDLTNLAYVDLKKKFEQFRGQDESIRFVYILGYNAHLHKQFFYVDSEEPSSKDYSPPGQIFDQTTQLEIDNYIKGVSFTEGPYTDSWGTWISGYVPIKDIDGSIIGSVGVDISTAAWYRSVRLMQLIDASLVFVFCLLIIVLSFIFYKKKQKLETISTTNVELEKSLKQIKAVQILAHIGRIGINITDGYIAIDPQFAKIFPVIDLDKIPMKVFTDKIHQDDRETFQKMLVEIQQSSITYNWCDVRIGDMASGYRHYHIYGNVESDSKRSIISFMGVMQDITDIEV